MKNAYKIILTGLLSCICCSACVKHINLDDTNKCILEYKKEIDGIKYIPFNQSEHINFYNGEDCQIELQLILSSCEDNEIPEEIKEIDNAQYKFIIVEAISSQNIMLPLKAVEPDGTPLMNLGIEYPGGVYFINNNKYGVLLPIRKDSINIRIGDNVFQGILPK